MWSVVALASTVVEPEKKKLGWFTKITVEKLFKVSQNRFIIKLFKFFGWATTPLCRDLD